jgi:hypothetical protein
MQKSTSQAQTTQEDELFPNSASALEPSISAANHSEIAVSPEKAQSQKSKKPERTTQDAELFPNSASALEPSKYAANTE